MYIFINSFSIGLTLQAERYKIPAQQQAISLYAIYSNRFQMKYLLISFLLFTLNTKGQINSDSAKCFVEHFEDKSESVFTKIETPGYFKGGSDAFLNFLISNIKLNNIVADLKQNDRLYSDTATVKFIISKKGVISDLTITGARKEIFMMELLETMKNSSCNWIPGNFSGRLVNGWFQMKIFYTIDRRRQEISTKVGYDMIEIR